jgi:hypothetical protein
MKGCKGLCDGCCNLVGAVRIAFEERWKLQRHEAWLFPHAPHKSVTTPLYFLKAGATRLRTANRREQKSNQVRVTCLGIHPYRIERFTTIDVDQNLSLSEQEHGYNSKIFSRLQENEKFEDKQRGMIRIRTNANKKHGDYFTEQHHQIRLVTW